MEEQSLLVINTDGSQYSHPRKAGFGFVFTTVDDNGEEVKESFSPMGFKSSTNNQMEILAPTEALKEFLRRYDFSRIAKILVKSDSAYFVNNFNHALYDWPKNDWRNRDGRPIDNVPIWKELTKAYKAIRGMGIYISFKWEPSKKSAGNKAADKLAKASAQNALNKPLLRQSVRRKLIASPTERGSVVMKGQQFQVYIQTTKPMGLGRGYQHCYQVLSKRSEFFGKTDFIYTDSIMVSDGHCYKVRVNKDTSYPKILKVFSELNCKTRKRLPEESV